MKKFGFVVALFLVMGVASIFAQEVQSGAFGANSTNKGYTLDKNSGDRTYSIEVNYSKGFDVKPEIILSVNSIDADKDTNLRYAVSANAVSRDGFVITIKTWGDTKIHSISGSWLAVSPGK